MKSYIFLLLGFVTSLASFSQGLKFNGGEQPIDKRTSYDVFSHKSATFSKYFNIEFDLSLYPTTQIGYIIRVKNEKNNKIYNLFYDGQGNNLVFKFNEEGKSSLITLEMDRELLYVQWFKMRISFDMESNSIKLTIDNQTLSAIQVGLPDKYYPTIIFGKSDHIIDVPSFAIKNLSVGNEVTKYSFALRENEGDIVHDVEGGAIGHVLNPIWLINDAYHWSFRTSFKSKTVAGANYNPEKKEIYYFNRDSIFIYDIKTGETGMKAFDEKCPVKLVLGTNFIDTKHNKLYAYEVNYGTPYNGPTIAELDLATRSNWAVDSYTTLPKQLHHHASFFDASTYQYIIFGGFGNMHYSKNFCSFDPTLKEWQVIEDFQGDTIFPRYFSSMGYLKKTNSLYIFGGMGNESGEQVVGRKYFYDLHKIDLYSKRITKLWEIPWNTDNVVPVRGMVILNDSCFYTLCYPEHFSDSFLRLYRFSIKDGSYEILGDSIPIHSDRITTNANLYYDEQSNHLYAIVQEFDDDIASDLKVYSLAFPPITAEDLVSYAKGGDNNMILTIIVLSFVSLVIISFALFKKTKQKESVHQRSNSKLHNLNKKTEKTTRPNAIYLFGDFSVRDRNNKDVTYMFSVRLKQTFCLILQHSMEDGISSQRLSNLLWPGKPEDKVKNSRGVTINHLRKALSELEGIELIHDKGYFKIVQSSEFYCDYTRCIQIISTSNIEENTDELIEILTRGKFLKFFDQPLFDSFKIAVEQKLEPVLLVEMEKSFSTEVYQTTINFAEAIFNIDPLNDKALAFQIRALQKLKKTEEAIIKYQAFVVEYKKMIGNDYPYSFKDLI